jgi:hypothetical protein
MNEKTSNKKGELRELLADVIEASGKIGFATSGPERRNHREDLLKAKTRFNEVLDSITEDDVLRDAVRRMASSLSENEFADHVLFGDEDVTALECEIMRLHGEIPSWQPIETAPRDGTSILGHDGEKTTSVFWQVLKNYPLGGEWWLTVSGDYAACCDWTPTHWMPLPENPHG